MLSSEERRSRLESLLERVRQNRKKERAAADLPVKAAVAEEAPAEVEIEEPLTAEPIAEEQVAEEPAAAQPDLIPADDEVEREFFESELSPPIEVVEEEEGIEEDLVVEEEPTPASVEEAFFNGDSQELVRPYESEEDSDTAEDEDFAEVEELPETEDVAEVEELTETDELEEVVDTPEPEVEHYQAVASASGDVAVFKGEKRPREWTLGAVLNRAWKLGKKE